MPKPSFTQIRKILSLAVFDPRKPGPMKVMTDVDNIDYYRGRAIELIHDSSFDPDKLIFAIRLLAYIKAIQEQTTIEKP